MDMAFSECPGCVAAAKKIAELAREIAHLTQQNAQLQARLKQLEGQIESLSRAAKRQAAPFSRNVPKTDPQKPGRKAGADYGTKAFRTVPEKIDEVYDAPLPARCPYCGGTVFRSVGVREQYQVEIPRKPIHRQFHVAVGQCTCCGKRVQGRHPLQTSNAVGCCASQVGPEAQAAVVMLNKELGLSQGKISRFFKEFFGITLTRGGSCQIMLRAATRCQQTYQALVKRVQESPWIVPDETGWRIGGHGAWLHVAVGIDAVAYLVGKRGIETSRVLIGKDYAGKLIHDGWAPYDQFYRAVHQTCLGHLLQRCKEILETATRGAVVFPRQIKALLQEALEIRDQRDQKALPPAAACDKADALAARLDRLLYWTKSNAVNERFAKHLAKHRRQVFTFLRHEGIDATNHQAEQAIRPAVVNRKVWGGNRTEAGAIAQAVLMTVLFTARKNASSILEFLSRQLRSPQVLRPPLPAPGG
jgi:transposase